MDGNPPSSDWTRQLTNLESPLGLLLLSPLGPGIRHHHHLHLLQGHGGRHPPHCRPFPLLFLLPPIGRNKQEEEGWVEDEDERRRVGGRSGRGPVGR